MFDVFYFGPKPDRFAHEQPADSLEAAAKKSRTRFYWYIYGGNDYANFDFDFVPPPWEEHQTHVWPNQWQPDGEVYLASKDNTDLVYNYRTEVTVPRLPVQEFYSIPDYVDRDSIDWSWCPDPASPPYIYVFGNQWNPAVHEPTVTYTVPGATQYKFVEDKPVKVLPVMDSWKILDDIKYFDYSWRPNPKDPPYIYVFGNQWMSPEIRPALEYTVSGAVETKYMEYPRAIRNGQPEKFTVTHAADFDFSWEPDPGDPPYIYVFGNQWYPAEIMPTVEYAVAGATERKFLDYPRAQLPVQHDNHWRTLMDCDWDYSWVPDPGDPPYIYVFGNQWHDAEVMPTVEYHVPGAVEHKYLEYPKALLLPLLDRWVVPEEINIDNIDFTWHPHPADCFVHHFGSQYQKSTGLTYTTPGATEIKLEDELPIKRKDQSTISVLDIFFVDRGNSLSAARFEQLQQRFPAAQKIRYANSMLATVRRCVTRTSTNKFWVISSENIYSEFDFAWHAEPWQSYMTHIFGSQWQKWSDTYLINKWEFERHAKWATALEQFPNLNFVKNQTVHRPDDLHDIYYVDHNNTHHQLTWMQQRYPDIKITRFVDNYLDTFKRIMTTATTEYIWITSSICDYTKFDFSWQPEPWQKEMIHVFPSGNQRRGDTFYIHVESFKTQMYELELLDWFDVINYCEDQYTPRFAPPTVVYQGDTIIDAIKNSSFDFPYAVFMHYNDRSITVHDTPCLWSAKDRAVTPLTPSGSTSLVPREAKSHIVTQVYDYKYINKDRELYARADSLDVIFISNGESMAEENWAILKAICPRARRSQGVTGRELAYKAAASLSSTPWFYAVFAKTEVLDTFSFEFQPDYYQEPKHYIFHSRNPLNGLEYGAMNVNLYNKQLVLDTDPGLDFTLSKAHEVVPVCISISRFNTDPWITWRSAFREVLKLKREVDDGATVEIEHRLNVWCTVAEGDNAKYCLQGAHDALEFYAEVNGDYTALKQSFDWAWCQQYYYSKYKKQLWLETV